MFPLNLQLTGLKRNGSRAVGVETLSHCNYASYSFHVSTDQTKPIETPNSGTRQIHGVVLRFPMRLRYTADTRSRVEVPHTAHLNGFLEQWRISTQWTKSQLFKH